MITIQISDILLVLGIIIAVLAIADLRAKWRQHCGVDMEQSLMQALYRQRWLRRIFGVRIAALLGGIILSAVEILHQYYMHLQLLHP